MKDLELTIKKYLEERGWDTLRPADIAKSVSIEAAELLELFQWSNDELDAVKKDEAKIAKIKKELADVLIYALEMSVLLELDTEEIIRAKLEHAAKKYPAAPDIPKIAAFKVSKDNKILRFVSSIISGSIPKATGTGLLNLCIRSIRLSSLVAPR